MRLSIPPLKRSTSLSMGPAFSSVIMRGAASFMLCSSFWCPAILPPGYQNLYSELRSRLHRLRPCKASHLLRDLERVERAALEAVDRGALDVGKAVRRQHRF